MLLGVSYQPAVTGHRYLISAGHYLATQAGFEILEAGGNAIDAGVAAGMALAVVQPDIVQFAGVAPIMIRPAATGEVITISGLGHWPRTATLERFIRDHGGTIPRGVLRTVVPAAPDAWIQALSRFGTMSFGEVSTAAIRYARDGFTVHELLHSTIAANAEAYAEWPENASLFLPAGRPPEVGSLMRQPDLASSIQHMVDEERTASGSREAKLDAARDAFYVGDIAATMVAFQEEQGGLIDRQDLAEFASSIGAAEHRSFGTTEVYSCGPWCQGPTLLQMLALLDGIDLAALGHNSGPYLHVVTEAMKLAFADREAYYGDPHFVDVPMERLLSDAYNAERRAMIRPDVAWPGLPQPGLTDETDGGPSDSNGETRAGNDQAREQTAPAAGLEPDTSYVSVIDGDGNAFSATPSDATYGVPMVPGLGFAMSGRGSQSFAVPGHPSSIAPGKRPRLTPNPAIAVSPEYVMAFGTPGGDSQCQAMLQFLLNIDVFAMSPQDAVEAPRVITHSHPSSFEPHRAHPGRLDVEDRIDAPIRAELARLGHGIVTAPAFNPGASAVCAVLADTDSGVRWGAADPRRPGRAMGW